MAEKDLLRSMFILAKVQRSLSFPGYEDSIAVWSDPELACSFRQPLALDHGIRYHLRRYVYEEARSMKVKNDKSPVKVPVMLDVAKATVAAVGRLGTRRVAQHMLVSPDSYTPYHVFVDSNPSPQLSGMQRKARQAAEAYFGLEPVVQRCLAPQQTSLPRTFIAHAGCYDTLGVKSGMEDRHCMRVMDVEDAAGDRRSVGFFAIFDGHRGFEAAEYASSQMASVLRCEYLRSQDWNEAFTSTVAILEDTLRHEASTTRDTAAAVSPGTTVIAAVIDRSQVIVCNLGDSRAALSRVGHTVGLSLDHKYYTHIGERRRLDAHGVHVDQDGYLEGEIPISRALGDYRYASLTKLQGLISEPDVLVRELGQEDEFLLLASDGVFDTMSTFKAVTFVRQRLACRLFIRLGCCRQPHSYGNRTAPSYVS
ncbi:MAG: uncharacterized protein KVP18_000694 [Porospora cf. gigantea A]|uniref:uncharacterized protein n=1 Tax=Porospora cf. gigantea A TaxID=2853593 RepID=UPI00355982DE|nr:MAG: hypothetical protein KVP18_000694 [Porospora cf. gigantea A]